MAEKDLAKDESLRLTRSSTIFHALVRIFGSGKLPSRLVLHVVGADHREGSTPQQTRSVFTDLFQSLGQDEHVQDLDLLFCGPNIPSHLHNTLHSFPYQHDAPEKARSGSIIRHQGDENNVVCAGERQQSPAPVATGALKVRFRYNSGLYHNIAHLFAAADALFLFNAGLWGYDDWEPTLEHVLGPGYGASGACLNDSDGVQTAVPPPYEGPSDSGKVTSPAVVVTSYCPEEASDDMETIQRVLWGDSMQPASESEEVVADTLEWLWEPEVNPHRSLVPRRTECGVEGRILFENQSWQALRRFRRRESCHM